VKHENPSYKKQQLSTKDILEILLDIPKNICFHGHLCWIFDDNKKGSLLKHLLRFHLSHGFLNWWARPPWRAWKVRSVGA